MSWWRSGRWRALPVGGYGLTAEGLRIREALRQLDGDPPGQAGGLSPFM